MRYAFLFLGSLFALLAAPALSGPGDYWPWGVKSPGEGAVELVPGLSAVRIEKLVGIDFPKDGVMVIAEGEANTSYENIKLSSLEYFLPDPIKGPIDGWYDFAVTGKKGMLTVVSKWTAKDSVKEKGDYVGVRIWAANGCMTVKWDKKTSGPMDTAACRMAK